MCYTGKCGYESYEGECNLKDIPNDAYCVIMEIENYKSRKEELEKNLKFLIIKTEYEDEIIKNLEKNLEKNHNKEKISDLSKEMHIFNELESIYYKSSSIKSISDFSF